MTDTATDLHRWYCEIQWCPTCSNFENSQCVTCSPHQLVPALWDRCPETRVEGLEWQKSFEARDADALLGMTTIAAGWWLDNALKITPAHAAALLVYAVEHGAKLKRFESQLIGTASGDQWRVRIGNATAAIVAPTLPEAVALARHRAADAEGQG